MTELSFSVDYAPDLADFAAVLDREGMQFTPYSAFYEVETTPEDRFNPKLAVGGHDVTTNWLKRYFKYQSRGTNRLGVLSCANMRVTEEWGLAVAPSGLAVTGMHGFGWNFRHFGVLAGSSATTTKDQASFSLPVRDRKTVALEGTAAMLSFPGALTYGHWIVDVAGRMEILNALVDMNLIEHFLLPRVASWMRPFLVAYGIRPDRIVELDAGTIYEVPKLLVPTTLSHQPGGTLPIRLARVVFRRLAAINRQWGKTTGRKKRAETPLVFLAHTRQTSGAGREIANLDQLLALVKEKKGKVVDPLQMSLADLAAELSGARLVVAQDSSVLHNIIFAPADILLIETERRHNLLHPSIQEAIGRRLAYFPCGKSDQGWHLDLPRFQPLLERLLK